MRAHVGTRLNAHTRCSASASQQYPRVAGYTHSNSPCVILPQWILVATVGLPRSDFRLFCADAITHGDSTCLGKENGQRPTSNAQRPTPNGQRPTSNAQRPTPKVQCPTSNVQRPTSNVQRPRSNAQRPTSNVQRPTSNVRRPTANGQRPMSNAPHAASILSILSILAKEELTNHFICQSALSIWGSRSRPGRSSAGTGPRR